MKSYTDIEQSRKLAKILPIESADMFYDLGESNIPNFIVGSHSDYRCYIPCWSFAALLGVLPKPKVYYSTDKTKRWYCECWNSDGDYITFTKADNPVDACVAMIENLNELNLL